MSQTIVPAAAIEDAANPSRRIELGGCFNFRDVGGYGADDGRTVRWRRLFRSDALHRLTEDDLALLRPFGITSIIDLRSDKELAETGPSPLHNEPGATHLRAPFIREVEINLDPDAAEPPNLGDIYADMLRSARPAIAAVFAHLAQESAYPAVVHCAAGKDRTGMTVALVLRAAGVSDDDIVADYALTEGYLAEYVETLRTTGNGGQFDRVHPDLLRAQAGTMRATLAALDAEHGDTRAFLASCGVVDATVDALRSNLLG